MTTVTSWGRLSPLDHEVYYLTERPNARNTVQTHKPGLAYGNGRSYGDVCLNPDGILWNTSNLDHFIQFNEATGRLVCEAGVLLRDIQRLAIPRGWMLPVTPGTQLVTVGGAIANDVHGKNHHGFGSFGDHLREIELLRTDGETIFCSQTQSENWFAATVGGLGLTGLILTAEIQLQPTAGPWLETETVPYKNLDEFFALADESEADWEHTVSWIDCINNTGRGLFMRGRTAKSQTQKKPPSTAALTMPFVPPFSLVNKLSLKPFNSTYYHLKKWGAGTSTIHYEPFFYPLDNLHEWNRMYGPKGFYQYQCVIPREHGNVGIQTILKRISAARQGSFLAVLKTFGTRKAVGMLSFPQPGVTLALDFPNKGNKTLQLFESLDVIVREAGGRLYPAKDARMPKDLFESGYPQLNQFLQYRDPGISSAMSRRLMGF